MSRAGNELFILVDQYGCLKNVPKKEKNKIWNELIFYKKKKFYETLHYSLFHYWLPLIDYHYWISLKYGKQRGFKVLTVLSTKQWNAFAPTLLHKLTIFKQTVETNSN